MDLRTVFIKNLKRCRKGRKLSQQKLAELCGTSTNYIGEIEIGKKFPSVEMIQKISDALYISPYTLFMEDSDRFIATIEPQKKTQLIEKLQKSIEEIIKTEML